MIKQKSFAVWSLCLASIAVCGAASLPSLTVRVDGSSGAPRIVVNGRPVRSRIFWGAPGTTPLRLSTAWQEVRFEFTAEGDAANGTMHFRFGQTPGSIYLDALRVTDADTGRDLIPMSDFSGGEQSFSRDWTTWPPPPANTVGVIDFVRGAAPGGRTALHVRLTAPPGGSWPDFHLYHHPVLTIEAGHHYRVSFLARADAVRTVTVAFYRPGESFVHLGGPGDCFPAQIKLAAAAGINIVSFPVNLPWPAPGEPVRWDSSDAQCEAVLRANPRALLLPRIGMNPPAWWQTAHPDDVMRWEDGRRDDGVVASPRYREDAAERLAALVSHLEARFGDHVAGYHPTGQNTGEWFYRETWDPPLSGYAPADLTAWRGWLAARYGSDSALRRAWNDPAVSLHKVAAPSAARRHAAPAGIFRDPRSERDLIDWAEFQQREMADCVRALAHAARVASHGRKLVVFFYGYIFEFGTCRNGPATAGHYALRRVLDCPDIDVLCSPISYFDRDTGGSAPCMTAAESVALAGKLWLNEDDTRTYLAADEGMGWLAQMSTPRATYGVLSRNVAQEATRNFGTWWMDLGSAGWFDDPAMWALMKSMAAVDVPLLRKPTPFRPEVAAVIDERCIKRVAAGGHVVTEPCLYTVRAALGRLGAPYGQYLIDDVFAGRVHAKLYVFLNAWALTSPERAQLRRATRGAACIWCYAPAYFDGDRCSLDAMHDLTGFSFKLLTNVPASVVPTAAGRQQGIVGRFGVKKPVRPLFAVTASAGVQSLAGYPDGEVGIARRRNADGTSYYVGAPGLTSDLLRSAARTAGVHLFTQTDCSVYANGAFVAAHAPRDGRFTVDMGRPGPVRDVLSGAFVGAGPRVTLQLRRGETRVLR